MPGVFEDEQIASFHRDGFAYARGLFDVRETELLRRAMEEDPAVREHVLDRADGEGGATKIALWNRAGDSVYGLAARSERMVHTAQALLGGAVIIEIVFARQGIGRIAVEALRARDFPVAQGVILYTALAYVFVNLVVDLLYAVVDPRIRYD